MELTPPSLNDGTSLQTKTAGKEQPLTEKNNGFLQNLGVTEGAMNLLREMTKMDQSLDGSDNKDKVCSETPQTDFLHKDMLEPKAEQGQDLQKEQDEQKPDLVHEVPQVSTSMLFPENKIPELSPQRIFLRLNYWNAKMGLQVKDVGADHIDWMEKINNIIQKINTTESTVKSGGANGVKMWDTFIAPRNPSCRPEVHHCPQAKLLEKIIEIRKQLREMNNKLTQVDACNEAHELKEKLIERIENFYKEMTLLNTKLGRYQIQERETDSYNSEEMNVEETDPLLPEASPPPLEQNSPPHIAAWKRALRIFIMFYVLTFTGISCYVLFVDGTFIFERVLPSILGRRTMWELREMIGPFLNLEVEDLLPS
ncbi:single-pass membrane and coiled-coil domain-containing protein 2 [Marmota marmota marmota]|uniref:single-pass membrane and coiled-coil domain-containing protein 2 n=1 Tax=Marmota marmota marmota TaxID=9994 RepID=UPI000762BB73|nr:single-pass membrane and coiled-coil domain-containing protein 2 [Marmota marmota marmota]